MEHYISVHEIIDITPWNDALTAFPRTPVLYVLLAIAAGLAGSSARAQSAVTDGQKLAFDRGKGNCLTCHAIKGGDLPEKADIFVSELINIGMLAPRMLSVLQHARTHLVKPGGAIIPRASTVYAMLVETPELARINPVETIDGFDMGSFDVFRSPGYQQIDLGADAHTPLSKPFTALDFDFTRNMPEEGERVIDVTIVTAGTCHGVAFWFDLFMDDEVVYKSESRARTNHWKQAMTFLEKPIALSAGDRLRIVARYDNNQISFGVDGLAGGKQG